MKTKTIIQVGVVVGGVATLDLWGGSRGTIQMKDYFLPNGKITPKNILRCVNDNGFGCERISDAEIDIYIKYNNGSIEYDRTLRDFTPRQKDCFLGWQELQEQGIELNY